MDLYTNNANLPNQIHEITFLYGNLTSVFLVIYCKNSVLLSEIDDYFWRVIKNFDSDSPPVKCESLAWTMNQKKARPINWQFLTTKLLIWTVNWSRSESGTVTDSSFSGSTKP